MNFFQHLLIEGTRRWGGLAAVSGHFHMAVVDWHAAVEVGIPLLMDALVVTGLWLEWREKRKADEQE
jgi:hypothetical protein